MNPQEPSEVYIQTFFYCIPLRLGVLVSAAVTEAISIVYVCSRSAYYDTFRNWAGGYALSSRIVVGAFEVTGLVFAMLGILGTWYMRTKWVQMYNYWQIARILGWLYVFHIDVPLLLNCESWINSISTTTQSLGWNELMYNIAIAGDCDGTRMQYFIFSGILFTLFVYITYRTNEFLEKMNRVPKHLLQLPKDMTSSAFYSASPSEPPSFGVRENRHVIGQAPDPEMAPLLPPGSVRF